ncbi:Vacuolar amino acid permease [Mycena chlorophos]|uniref:Vacuolar amino acid permease n=1 Tax=Mycena chlorophos TaxID=658473 RepID=A0A8H6SBP1_MYCCL|nr:Vacuolar amino acid permease [Mycena chlorophos]
MSTPALSERDPLLPKQSPAAPTPASPDSNAVKTAVGPLDIPPATRRWVLAGIWMGTFLGALNLTLVPTMMPAIASEFQKFHQASWLGTANFLAACTFTPLYGRLSNVLGRRLAYQTAILFTAVGALGCGTARSMEELTVSQRDSLREWAEVACSLLLLMPSRIIVSDMYPLRHRGLVQALASCFNSLGMGLGGPLGGIVTDLFGWRVAFLMQLPLFVAAAIITQFKLDYTTPGKSRSAKEILGRIDYFGTMALLLFVGSFSVLLSTRYNESLPWPHPTVLIPLVLTIASFVAFIFIELRIAPEPIMPASLLVQRVTVLIGASNSFVTACTFSLTYFFPLWFQVVELKSAATAGLHLMPNSVSLSLGSVFAGWMMHRTGTYKSINLFFGVLPFIGAGLIASINERSGWVVTWFSIIPFGFGNAVVLQTMLIALMAYLPRKSNGRRHRLRPTVPRLGYVATPFSSAIFQSRLDSELHKRFPPDSDKLILRIRRSAAVIRDLLPEEQRLARDAYAISLRAVYVFAAASTLIAYLVRLPIPDQDLDTAHGKKKPGTLIAPAVTTVAEPQTSVSAERT